MITYRELQKKFENIGIVFVLEVDTEQLPFRLKATFRLPELKPVKNIRVELSYEPILEVRSSNMATHPNFVAQQVWEHLQKYPITRTTTVGHKILSIKECKVVNNRFINKLCKRKKPNKL